MREIILSTNAESWDSGYSITLTALDVPDTNGNRYFPIEPFTVPILYESHILMVATEIPTANPRWRMGIRLKQLLEANYLPVPNAQANDVIVAPNKGRIIAFQRLTEQYRLEIWIPWWIKEVTVRIWQYIGTDETRLENLVTEKTDVIRVDLARIETKVDNLS